MEFLDKLYQNHLAMSFITALIGAIIGAGLGAFLKYIFDIYVGKSNAKLARENAISINIINKRIEIFDYFLSNFAEFSNYPSIGIYYDNCPDVINALADVLSKFSQPLPNDTEGNTKLFSETTSAKFLLLRQMAIVLNFKLNTDRLIYTPMRLSIEKKKTKIESMLPTLIKDDVFTVKNVDAAIKKAIIISKRIDKVNPNDLL